MKKNLTEIICWCAIVGGVGTGLYIFYDFHQQSSQVKDAPEQSRSLVADWNDTRFKPDLSQGTEDQDPEIVIPPKKVKTCGLMGSVYIPRIGKKMPYVRGTSKACLKKGLGLFIEAEELVSPGETGRCIISGHRDTHFREARDILLGDRFLVTSVEKPQKLFVYQYKNRQIIDEDDTTVVHESNKPELCLTTCYPFTYVGSAPQRYVMCGSLVEVRTLSPAEWQGLVEKDEE